MIMTGLDLCGKIGRKKVEVRFRHLRHTRILYLEVITLWMMS